MYLSPLSPPTTHDVLLQRESQCGFEGNSDLYGLGIRLAFYFQWASAFICTSRYPEAGYEVYVAYMMFIFAIDITLIVITARSESTHVAEILILIYFIFGGLQIMSCSGVSRALKLELRRNRHKTLLKQLRNRITAIISVFSSIYCCWFWLGGIKKFPKTPCGTYGFLFSKVSLYNPGVRYFFAALSIIYAATALLSNGFLIFLPGKERLLTILAEIFGNRIEGDRGSDSDRGSDDTDKLIHRATTISLYIVSGFYFIFSLLAIELTLYWNSITGIYTINTAGQLIPFVIALCGLVKIIYEAVYPENEPSERNTPATGQQSEVLSHPQPLVSSEVTTNNEIR